MKTILSFLALTLLLSPLTGCLPEPPKKPGLPPPPEKEPDYVKVQHILVSHKSTKEPARTPEQSREKAYRLFEEAKNGGDFDAMMKEHSEDPGPGIYGLANRSAPPRPNYTARTGMVPGFGDISFSLKVGDFGIVDHDPQKSFHGWHIIKRLE